MNLRLEILQQPRGTMAEIRRKSGLSKMTIHRAIHGVRCGAGAAKKIARAYGQPERWPEILDDQIAPPERVAS